MKKIFVLIVIIIIPFFTSCKNHKCKNFDYRVIVEATCIEMGIEESFCVECGKSQEQTRKINKIPHNTSDWILVKESTCTENGIKQIVCNDCGIVVNESLINKLEHNESAEKIENAVTCTENGLSYTECLTCGVRMSEVVIHSEGHSFDEWEIIQEATCTEKGKKKLTCTICYETIKEEEIKELGHISKSWKVTKNASCLEDGEKIKECEVCEEVYEREIIPSEGHTLSEWNIVIPKTCSTDGLKQKECIKCELILEEEIIQASHTIVIDERIEPTCTSEGLTEGQHCSVCKEVFLTQNVLNKVPHEIIIDQSEEPTCLNDGKTEGKHCKNCSYVEVYQDVIEALGHSFDIQTNMCSRCNEKEYMEFKTYDDWSKGVGEKEYVVWLSYMGFENSKYYSQTIPNTVEYIRLIGNSSQEYMLNLVIGSRNKKITIEFVNVNLTPYQNNAICCDSVIDIDLSFYGEKCSLIPVKASNGRNGGISNAPESGTAGYAAIYVPHATLNIFTCANELSIIGGEGGNGGNGCVMGTGDTKGKPGGDGGTGIFAGEINLQFGGQSSMKNIEVKGGTGGKGGEHNSYSITKKYAADGNTGDATNVAINYILD